jgi:hypothetical protein
VPPQFSAAGTTFDILIQGESRRATVLAEPAFDPGNLRMRA